jgi:hypothetical protein
MQICTTGNLARRDFGEIRSAFGSIVPKSRLCTAAVRYAVPAASCFISDYQPVAAAMSTAHGALRKNSTPQRATGFGSRRIVLMLGHLNKGGTKWTLP